MKTDIKISGIILAAALLLSSCVLGTQQPAGADGRTRSLEITIDDSGEEDSREKISTVRLIVFNDVSTPRPVLDANVFQAITEATGTGFSTTLQTKVNPDKMVVAIVNEPTSLTASLAAVTSPGELEAIAYSFSDFLDIVSPAHYVLGSSNMPMTGVIKNVAVNASDTGSNPKKITMHVERVVARVDFYLRTEEGITVTLTPDDTMLILGRTYGRGNFVAGTETDGTRNWAAPSSPDNFGPLQTVTNFSDDFWEPAASITITSDDGIVPVCSFYTSERTCVASEGKDKLMLEWIGFGNNDGKYTLTQFKREGSGVYEPLTIIKRNNIYRITGIIKENSVEFEHKIVPWTGEELGIIIDPQYYLRISNDELYLPGDGDQATVSAETNYDREDEDRGFPKGIVVGSIKYYDNTGQPVTDTGSGIYGWLTAVPDGAAGDLDRNILLRATGTPGSGNEGCYATVEVKAGNLTKLVKVSR